MAHPPPIWRRGLRRISTFRVDDWRVVGESIVTLVVVQIGLHLIPPKRLTQWAVRVSPAKVPLLAERVRPVAYLVDLTARYVVPVRCLVKSLALARILGRRGVVTEVRVGVRTEEGKLKAHAWVMFEGQALNENERMLKDYVEFDRSLGDASRA